MRKSKTAAVTAALALMAAPALAQGPEKTPKGQTTSPAKLCQGMSKKKVPGTNGQTAFAACVSGAKKAGADAKRTPKVADDRQSPTQICRAITPALSRKKAPGTKKSPWAACVSGAAKAQNQQETATTS